MFTGIIEATGNIVSLTPTGGDVRVTVNSSSLDLSDVSLGDSIATNGVCLTVIELLKNGYAADISNETLSHTGFRHYRTGQIVNLEKAMLPTTRFGGHIVSGHVDALATVSKIMINGRAKDIWIQIPKELDRYIVKKGSICIDGVSLTVNDVNESEFKLTIVPHTAQETTLESLQSGSKVNLEIDVIARYMEKLMQPTQGKGVTMDLLAKSGYIK